jgi:cytoskeleton-associated protein 5
LAIQPACVVSNIDLLLKWASLRFFDTNPAVLIKLLEFIQTTFAYMEENGERLNDQEMMSFLPYLLLKVYHL